MEINLDFTQQLAPVDATDKTEFIIKDLGDLLLQLQSLREEANYMIKCRLRDSIWYRDRNALEIVIKALNKILLEGGKWYVKILC